MVAISLYRGNLHRTPDVPRRWLMPNPKISLKDFKTLLARRSKALSRSQPTTSSNPNPNLLSNASQPQPSTSNQRQSQLCNQPDSQKPIHQSDFKNAAALEKPLDDAAATSIDKHTDDPVIGNEDLNNDKEKRKKEVEGKLQVLNAKKHNLVLVLKQILNAEEELNRRNNVQQQGVSLPGPSVPLKSDGTNDTSSGTRYMAMRLGCEGNLVGDMDGGEADDSTNHNMQHSRQVLQTSSMSPSSESPLRRTPSVQQNTVSNPARASFPATSSPSCFANSGQQGNPINIPSVTVSGTSYIASSPSPAASGGTSVFREARHPSPWK